MACSLVKTTIESEAKLAHATDAKGAVAKEVRLKIQKTECLLDEDGALVAR